MLNFKNVKSGDILKVRKDLVDGGTYGTNQAVETMLDIRGEFVTVVNTWGVDSISIEESGWTWTAEMFEDDIYKWELMYKVVGIEED